MVLFEANVALVSVILIYAQSLLEKLCLFCIFFLTAKVKRESREQDAKLQLIIFELNCGLMRLY